MNNVTQRRNQNQSPLLRSILAIAMSVSFVVVLSQLVYTTQVLAQPIIVHNNSSSANTMAAIIKTPTIGKKNSGADLLTLGHPFLVENGKIIVQRVTGITNGLPRIETSFSANDTINGNVTAKAIGTYVTNPRPSIGGGDANVIYGEGQGVITTTKDGQMATWTGQGIGHFTSDGKLVLHGSLFFSTTSTGKLAFINNMVEIFQYEADALGNTSTKVWGWK